MIKNLGIEPNQLDICINGKEGLEKVIETYKLGFTYRLILTDFQMPVMDGIESTKAIRSFLTAELNLKMEDQPRILGVTGHVLDEFKKKGLKAGMDDILAKPLYTSILKDALLKYHLIQ